MKLPFNTLLGMTLVNITGVIGSEEIIFETSDGRKFSLYHEEDCCESVSVNDIIGDFNDLLNTPILQAEEASDEMGEPKPSDGCDDSWTWTFYKLATIKGYVTIRWLGESNGYYSESVTFAEL